jgi:serine/threonine protein kinase
MIPQNLSHYKILEKLGDGGMGVVYKAQDTHLNRLVAIKVLPADKLANEERKARFVREARAASSLNHPSIITIHDIANDQGIDFIVMEYVAGKTLGQLIPRKGMRLEELLKLAIPMADALAAAHAEGIVHRDLKPGNVMVTDSGRVKVLDFGLAKLSDKAEASEFDVTQIFSAGDGPKTDEGTILGTVSYMSPEQAEGKPVDARSDIFSFGALFYEMATGQRAFQGDSGVSILAAILHKDPKPVSGIGDGIPRELEDSSHAAARIQHAAFSIWTT